MSGKSVNVGSSKIKLDVTGLQNLERQLKRRFAVRVGVLGAKTNRPGPDGTTNAEIGLTHEKGSKSRGIPRRSFLEMPLNSPTMEKVMGTVGKQILEDAVTVNDVKPAYTKLGVAGEAVVQKAFATGGYGTWKPLKPATIAAKGSSKILIDTAELRKSISSAVVEKS